MCGCVCVRVYDIRESRAHTRMFIIRAISSLNQRRMVMTTTMIKLQKKKHTYIRETNLEKRKRQKENIVILGKT